MVWTLVISISTFILITLSLFLFPKIKIKNITLSTYWIIALVGASILLISSLSPINEVYNELTSSKEINPLKILILFFSMTLISIYLDEYGLFRFLASLAIKKANKSQYTLFIIFYLLTAVLTVFTSNDIVILTLTPFIIFFSKNAKINPLPYLIMEFAVANTWSMMFIIGNPTNIYLASSANINFISYFKVMWLPTLTSGIIEFIIIYLLFKKDLKNPISINNDEYHIDSKVDLTIGISVLAICLIFLVISSYINVEMYLVSLICAGVLTLATITIRLFTKKHYEYIYNPFKRLPYPLIPFFLSMFVIVVSYNHMGISSKISELLGSSNSIWIYGYSSFISSNVINNIPMSILYSSLTSNLTGSPYIEAIYSTIIGSNIGAFLTPIGALAGIMFSSLLNKYEVKFSFATFIKYGVIISIPVISPALAVLYLVI